MPKGIRSLANGGPSNPFGGPAITGGAGITPIKMQAAQVRFPTARGPVRRAPEPTTKEILGPLLGFGANSLLSGLGGLFGKDEPETREEILESIGASQAQIEGKEELSEIDRAKLQAYQIYGAPTEKDSFGLDEIANLVIASQMGRGGPGFIKGVLDSKKATELDRRTVTASRSAYINKLLEPVSMQDETYVDYQKARMGVLDIRNGMFNPKTGESTIYAPTNENANDVGYVSTGDEAFLNENGSVKAQWIALKDLPKDQGILESLQDKNLTGTLKTIDQLKAKDAAMANVLIIANNQVPMLQEGIDDPTKAATNVVGALNAFGNGALSAFEGMAQSITGDREDILGAFSTDNTGGSTINGTGENAKNLYLAIKSGDEAQIEAATKAFEKNTNSDFRELLGDNAYRNVAVRANYLQLAYMLASANGQTGRTLSDKDLAYHLQIIGVGAKDNSPETQLANLLRVVDQAVEGVDATTQILLPRTSMSGIKMTDTEAASLYGEYYIPTSKLPDGTDNWSDYVNHEYRPFYQRIRSPAVKQWKQHRSTRYQRNFLNQEGPAKTGTGGVDVTEQFRLDTAAVEDLY
jgi:hypothetical protein